MWRQRGKDSQRSHFCKYPLQFVLITPLSCVLVVGSQVYYFPHGHSEQCPAPPRPKPVPLHRRCRPPLRRPQDRRALRHRLLHPRPHRAPAPDLPGAAAGPEATGFRYLAKQLTQSDGNNGGGFSVPRFCAKLVFPPLDFEADPPVQRLRMSDPLGGLWDFRHIYRGTSCRHLLSTGWSKFVNAKLLVAGDVIVFMRSVDGELLAAIRRAPRDPAVSQPRGGPATCARVLPQEVDEAVQLAAEGAPFTVTYYPRQGAGEFVVPKQEVEDTLVDA